VDVLLGRAEVPLHDIAQLEVGKVIPLTSAPGDTVTIEVDGTPRFHAKPATKNGRTVARITGIIRD
jgi:flagellar motor switch protein FliM